MFPAPTAVTAGQRELLKLWKRLGEDDRKSLMAFAEFLDERGKSAAEPVHEPQRPKDVPRPRQESVVAGIKRLSSTYYMIDKDDVLHTTSNLMAEHLLQGRPAKDVIDELERVFAEHYQRYRSSDH